MLQIVQIYVQENVVNFNYKNFNKNKPNRLIEEGSQTKVRDEIYPTINSAVMILTKLHGYLNY